MDAMEDTISIGLQVVEYFPDLLYKELAKKNSKRNLLAMLLLHIRVTARSPSFGKRQI